MGHLKVKYSTFDFRYVDDPRNMSKEKYEEQLINNLNTIGENGWIVMSFSVEYRTDLREQIRKLQQQSLLTKENKRIELVCAWIKVYAYQLQDE